MLTCSDHRKLTKNCFEMKYLFAALLIRSVGALTTPPETVFKTLSNSESRSTRRSFLGWTASLLPTCATALTPEEASRQYDTYASSYDNLDGGKASTALGIEDARRELIQKAKGNVLEIGVGTGTYQHL